MQLRKRKHHTCGLLGAAPVWYCKWINIKVTGLNSWIRCGVSKVDFQQG